MIVDNKIRIREQLDICDKFGAEFIESPFYLVLGISKNFDKNNFPINGLRHPTEGGSTGWFIWSGEELKQDADFFKASHIGHLVEICPEIIKFLGLPPGWRFLKAKNYEDVWVDEKLFEVEDSENPSSLLEEYQKVMHELIEPGLNL